MFCEDTIVKVASRRLLDRPTNIADAHGRHIAHADDAKYLALIIENQEMANIVG